MIDPLQRPRTPPPASATPPVAAARPVPARGTEADPFSVSRDLLHPTHYDRLGVPADADEVTLSEAYRRAAAEFEAGTGPDPQLTWPLPGVPESTSARQRQLQLAYQTLQDRERRAVYDQWLAREQQRAAAAQRRWPLARRWLLGWAVAIALGLVAAWLLR